MSQYATYIQRDENGIVELEANWTIEYTRGRDIQGDRNEPSEPGEVTIKGKTLNDVLFYCGDYGHEPQYDRWQGLQCELAKWLDEEELIACCERHFESLDDEGRRVA